MEFKLKSSFSPTGDQPQAIKALTQGVQNCTPHQVLLGVTGSGKTFTIANLIQNTQRPTLVISHNKTLAAQLYQEFRDFFPQNAVSYFVSYYDYYQPEAYIPQTDTYIEKEADINDDIDRLRLEATANLLTRKDVIVVASVSCIYNLGSPLEWSNRHLLLEASKAYDRPEVLRTLNDLQYDRSDYELKRGTYRVKGDSLEIWPAYEKHIYSIRFLDNLIEKIIPTDPVSGSTIRHPLPATSIVIYPAKHYLANKALMTAGFTSIKQELKDRVKVLKHQGKDLEAYRLNQKVNYDLEMIQELGYVNGIENYSRHFDGRKPGTPPYTLFDFFIKSDPNFLVVVDESHMTIPQINGMYQGDRSRKQTLIDFGFRLPSALDNRPLRFAEFLRRTPQAIYTSATPGDWELNMARSTSHVARRKNVQKIPLSPSTTRHPPPASHGIVEQLIRPTGLVDPAIEIRPTHNQIDNLITEINLRVARKQRILVTTLTKRTAEALSAHLTEKGIKIHYLHSDITTLDRPDILDSLRAGEYDVVVGINLLREGLDLPEVSLVAILDADKEGFLRSKTSLIQTMGRAARHQEGKVIMYADTVTGSMTAAIDEVNRRRLYQTNYNRTHHVTPKSINKPIRTKLIIREPKGTTGPQSTVIQLTRTEAIDLKNLKLDSLTPEDKKRLTRSLTRKMLQTARDLNFELAAKLRDTISDLKV